MNQLYTDALTYYPGLKRLVGYVKKNYSSRISLESAARIAAMEATYFSSFFSKKVGIPFSEWLTRFRVARAVELLKEGGPPPSEVAKSVGFSNLRAMERAFRKFHGDLGLLQNTERVRKIV